jgi:ferritin-like metal-binding protein YciE
LEWNLSVPFPLSRCASAQPSNTHHLEEEPMGLFFKEIKSLEDLFLHGLEDLYYAENQIVKSLPKMIENAHDAELKRGLQQHLRATENQIKRLQQVFKLNDRQASGAKCPAIDGILREGNDLMGEIEAEDVLNVGIVAAAQAVEHYEITRYGALIAWARELGRNSSVPLLQANLKEEKAADQKLTAIAEQRVNAKSEGGKKAASMARRRKSASGRRSKAAMPLRSGSRNRKPTPRRKTARRSRA